MRSNRFWSRAFWVVNIWKLYPSVGYLSLFLLFIRSFLCVRKFLVSAFEANALHTQMENIRFGIGKIQVVFEYSLFFFLLLLFFFVFFVFEHKNLSCPNVWLSFRAVSPVFILLYSVFEMKNSFEMWYYFACV